MREKRIAHLRELLQHDSRDSFSRYALALEFAGMGNVDEAIGQMEELLRIDPSYLSSYQQLGSLYLQVNRSSDAISILKRGIELARQQKDDHARSEMQESLDDILS